MIKLAAKWESPPTRFPVSQARVGLGYRIMEVAKATVPRIKPTTAAQLNSTSLRKAANLPVLLKSEFRISVPASRFFRVWGSDIKRFWDSVLCNWAVRVSLVCLVFSVSLLL